MIISISANCRAANSSTAGSVSFPAPRNLAGSRLLGGERLNWDIIVDLIND